MVKRKGKSQRLFYSGAKASPRSQYQDFIRSPKADEPSEEVPFDSGIDSGQVPPLYHDGRNLISDVPPASPPYSRIPLVDMLKIIFGVISILVLIVGILWGVFNIVRDVGDIKTSSSGIEKKADNILYKLDGQDKILNEIFHQKETGKVLQNQPSKKQP